MGAPDLLRNVSDTALWVAAYRADESERPDALFRDPWARRLAGERGSALAHRLPHAPDVAWAIVVRTVLFDEIVLRLVAEGADAVLNLAAGLDTRPYRLALPSSLLWVEVDLPGPLDAKEAILAGEQSACRLERVRLDLSQEEARRSFLAGLAARCQRILVLSEGLMIYLRAEDVAGLARDLHAADRYRWWLMDLDSPRLLRLMDRAWGKTFRAAEATMRFAPEEGPRFFRPYGWSLMRTYSFLEEARRLHRVRFWHRLVPFGPAAWRTEMLRLATADLLERMEGTP